MSELKNSGKRDVFSPLRNISVIANAGILSAIAIILGFFKIPVTQLIEIRFAVLPITIASYLFGPVVGGVVGLVSDIGGYILRPTGPFFPGFTVTSVITGVIFGCMLYKRRPTLLRILMAQIVYTAICGIFLNSLWLSMLYGNGFIPVLSDWHQLDLSWNSMIAWLWVAVLAICCLFLSGAVNAVFHIKPYIHDSLTIVFLITLYIIMIIDCYQLAKAFGKNFFFVLGLFFLFPIFMVILGADGSKYLGPQE